MSDASDDLRRYEVRWSAYKAIGVALVSTCVVGVFSAILNWQIQYKTLEIEREQTKRAQRLAEFERQQEYLSQFTEFALTENLQSRLDFASYVAHVAMDESLRDLWSDYSATLESQAARMRGALDNARDELTALVSETDGEIAEKSSEIWSLRQQIATMTDELEPPRRRVEGQAIAAAALRAKVVKAEADGQNFNVALDIENIGSDDLEIALIEPSSIAVVGDEEFGPLSVTGVYPCKSLKDCRPAVDFVALPREGTQSVRMLFPMLGDPTITRPASLLLNFAVLSSDDLDQQTLTTVGVRVPGIDLAGYN